MILVSCQQGKQSSSETPLRHGQYRALQPPEKSERLMHPCPAKGHRSIQSEAYHRHEDDSRRRVPPADAEKPRRRPRLETLVRRITAVVVIPSLFALAAPSVLSIYGEAKLPAFRSVLGVCQVDAASGLELPMPVQMRTDDTGFGIGLRMASDQGCFVWHASWTDQESRGPGGRGGMPVLRSADGHQWRSIFYPAIQLPEIWAIRYCFSPARKAQTLPLRVTDNGCADKPQDRHRQDGDLI